MGSVFMAEQMRPVKRMVAFKVIKAGMDSRQVLARFESERQALALMDHPNIAKVLDAGTTERGLPFFVMELVKGVPLTQFCDDRQLSISERLKVFQQICHAVQHAHQKGIIHRDLKPTNILIESHDGRPVPKVIDFGLAKAVSALPLTDRSLFTNFGAILGTPLYMAPEQAELSALDVDTRADIYALGVILYELLTGSTPLEKKRYATAAWDEVRRVIKEEEPPKPSKRLSTSDARASIAAQRQTEPRKLGKFMRGDLDWIVMKALAKERDRRYETANAFAADVEHFLNDEPVSAGPPTMRYKLRKFVHRNRGQVVVAAVVLLALLTGVTVSTWQAIRATQAEGRAHDEQEKTAQALIVADQNRQEADEQRKTADTQRKTAETQLASLAVDIDLKYCEEGEIPLGLLRLAQTMKGLPAHAKDLRECAALNLLAWGQQLRPAILALDRDGFGVSEAQLSPDGLTVMTSGRDGTVRLWDSQTGKQRALLSTQRVQGTLATGTRMQFSGDGKTAWTLIGGQQRMRSGTTGIDDGDRVVRLWDVATGQLRTATAEHSSNVFDVQLSRNGSLLVTACNPSGVNPGTGLASSIELSFWNATNGRLLRKVEVPGEWPEIAVSPDGTSVLLGRQDKFEVWFPEEGRPPKRLSDEKAGENPYPLATFSPDGRSAVTVSGDTIRWWNTADWQLQREVSGWHKLFPDLVTLGVNVFLGEPRFAHEDLVVLRLKQVGGFGGEDDVGRLLVSAKNSRELIVSKSKNQALASPDGALLAFDTNEVYETRSGRRQSLPWGRKFYPELRQFAEDGRFVLIPNAFVVELAVDKKIGFDADSRFLTNQQAWLAVDAGTGIRLLRKADASLDADLLQKWCQVVTRGKLDDDGGRFTKLDEAPWDKLRQELAPQLKAEPNGQVLQAVADDRLHWLRTEVAEAPTSLPLLDRLVAAEPVWANYSQRADAHAKQEHWVLAVRDELEAARLAGEGYWHLGLSSAGWQLGGRIVQTPSRPPEQYEIALRWADAKSRAGIGDHFSGPMPGQAGVGLINPDRTLVIGLGQFRLGRYAAALASLQAKDVPKLSQSTSVLMSQWNGLMFMQPVNLSGNPGAPGLGGGPGFPPGGPMGPMGMGSPGMPGWQFTFDPTDLSVRAMCLHHLKRPKEAGACLDFVHKLVVPLGDDQRAFVREAETLIEGKARP